VSKRARRPGGLLFFINRSKLKRSSKMSASFSTHCVECEGSIHLDNVIQGEIVVCPDCGVDLEVVSLSPMTLDLAPMEEEDWGE
jgi:alpha-aminoadipate carrier protein LysW